MYEVVESPLILTSAIFFLKFKKILLRVAGHTIKMFNVVK